MRRMRDVRHSFHPFPISARPCMKNFESTFDYQRSSSPYAETCAPNDNGADVQSNVSFDDDNEMTNQSSGSKSKQSEEEKRVRRLLRNREAARR